MAIIPVLPYHFKITPPLPLVASGDSQSEILKFTKSYYLVGINFLGLDLIAKKELENVTLGIEIIDPIGLGYDISTTDPNWTYFQQSSLQQFFLSSNHGNSFKFAPVELKEFKISVMYNDAGAVGSIAAQFYITMFFQNEEIL